MHASDLVRRRQAVFAQSLVALVVVWAALAHLLGLADTISSPELVGAHMVEIVQTGELVPNLSRSLGRILLAFGITVVVGTGLGLLMGMWSFWGTVFRPYIAIGLALPPLFAVVFPAMWFGVTVTTLVIAGTIAGFPFFARNVYAGVNDIDADLVRMGESFGLSKLRLVRRIILPSVMSEWFAGARYSFALCWKVVIFAEFLLGDTGVGARIGDEMDLLSISGVLAWTLLFVVAYGAIEYGIFQQIQSRVFDWREETSLAAGAG